MNESIVQIVPVGGGVVETVIVKLLEHGPPVPLAVIVYVVFVDIAPVSILERPVNEKPLKRPPEIYIDPEITFEPLKRSIVEDPELTVKLSAVNESIVQTTLETVETTTEAKSET